MKHSTYKILLLLLFAGLMGSSCLKEDIDIDLTAKDWKVVKIRKSGQLTFTGTDSTYILRFVSDEDYTLSLDVNNCFGTYDIPQKGNLAFQGAACTEICCDSEFAQDLSLLLSEMSSYYAKRDELHFEGDGKIVLKSY